MISKSGKTKIHSIWIHMCKRQGETASSQYWGRLGWWGVRDFVALNLCLFSRVSLCLDFFVNNDFYVSVCSISFLWTAAPTPSTSSREIVPNEQFHLGHPHSWKSSPLPYWAAISELNSVGSSKLLRICFPPVASDSHLFFGCKNSIFSLAHKLILLPTALGLRSSYFPCLRGSPFPSTHLLPSSVLACLDHLHNLTPFDFAGFGLYSSTYVSETPGGPSQVLELFFKGPLLF